MRWIKASDKIPPFGIYNAQYGVYHVLFQVHEGGVRIINYRGENNDSPMLHLVKYLEEPNEVQVSMKDALDIWDNAIEFVNAAEFGPVPSKYLNKLQYFKQKFNINIKNYE